MTGESTMPHGRDSGNLTRPVAATDVVFTFSYETWDDAVQRGMMRPPDRLLSTLLTTPLVEKLLVANPYRFLPSYAARRVFKPGAPFPTSDRAVLHTPMRMRRSDPLEPDAVAREYAAYDRSLRRAGSSLGLDEPVVLTTNPLVAGYGPFDWASRVSFFARDDWLSSPARQAYWPAYREAYRRISESGRSVTAVSQEIIDRIAPTGPHAVVPNGVEPAEWAGPAPEAPAWLQAIPGPRALYVGTLDSRLDVVGLADLARRQPDIQTILMGPLPDPSYIQDLRGLRNVHVRPSVGRAELVATMRNVDLCLLAHRRTPLTEAMSPLKIYEYLAGGCPVLSIDLPPIRGISDRVIAVDSVSDFADAADAALALGPASEADRAEFVAANSWSRRHETILGIALSA